MFGLVDTRHANIEKNPQEHDMSIYPLTPPSSNEESSHSFIPYPFALYDPFINQEQYGLGTNMLIPDHKKPYLRITEQPTDKFRFRYKSEMAGTHGSLTGLTSDKTRKQTYPSVKLHNYSGLAIIRCSLYQHGASCQQPHAHRLIKKHGNEEIDDPHNMQVSGGADDYEACFHSMGIIHTAKKHIVGELIRKKKLLKEEDIARNEKQKRSLKIGEEAEIKALAEEESKSINLNIVCLRFDAFQMSEKGILNPICPPVYSHAINNLKSALTGELKIVRMDHSSSPTRGNKEIFMLVEKVTKKNIKVRFFELDDEEAEIWYDFGKFNDLDVHHQYAIVFKTPPYKDQDIDQQKKVFIELLRPSDGSRSEPREFIYYPSSILKTGSKRSRSNYESSNSWSGSMHSADLPVSILSIPNLNTDRPDFIVSSGDLQAAMEDVNSEEFRKLFSSFCTELNDNNSLITDAPVGTLRRSVEGRSPLPKSEFLVSESDRLILNRVYEELKAIQEITPSRKKISNLVNFWLQKLVNKNGDNALHIAIMDNNVSIFTFILKQIMALGLNHILNLTNSKNETLMHIALHQSNPFFVKNLLQSNVDLSIQDCMRNTPLHVAIMKNCPTHILDILLRLGTKLKLNLDAENNDGHTPLHMAIKMNNLPYVELLHKYGVDVNVIDRKTGRTALHIAITEQDKHIVQFLIQNTKIDIQKEDYSNFTSYKMAKHLENIEPNGAEICRFIEEFLKNKGLHNEYIVKDEVVSSEDEMELEEVECKTESFSAEELAKLYENIREFSPNCLDALSEILDQSGSWENLACLLDLEHLLPTDLFVTAKSPSKALLKYATAFGDVLHIRNFLENLEEFKAVALIDKMAMAEKLQK